MTNKRIPFNPNNGLNYSDYADAKEFFKSVESSFNDFIPPVYISFNSKKELESFAETLCSLSCKKRDAHNIFECKLAKMGLAHNLYAGEIKGLEEEEFPIKITIRNSEDICAFASAYSSSEAIKRVTTKNLNNNINEENEGLSKKDKLIAGLIALASVALVLLVFNPYNKSEKTYMVEDFAFERAKSKVLNQDKDKNINESQPETKTKTLLELRQKYLNEYLETFSALQKTFDPAERDILNARMEELDRKGGEINKQILATW